MIYVEILNFMLPECIKNFEEVAPTARQIALYFASAEL
jgi:hypothetical protein